MHCVPGPDFSGQRVSPQSLSPHDLYFRYGFLPGSTCARAPRTAPPSCPDQPAAPSRARLRWVGRAVHSGLAALGVMGPVVNAPTTEDVHSQSHQGINDLLHREMYLAVAPCLSSLLIACTLAHNPDRSHPVKVAQSAGRPCMRSGRVLVVPLLQRLH